MAYVPPWLNIEPSQFVQAAAAGGRLGAELAGQANERGIAAARNAAGLQEAGMRESTALSGQQTEAELARARMEQAAKTEAADRLLKQWETQQQMIHNQAVIDAENQRNQFTLGAQNTRAAAALAERQKYGDSMLDIRREANRIAQQRADQAGAKPSPQDFITVTQHTKEVPPSKSYDITKPEIFNLFKANTPGSSMTTTNVADLQNLPRGSSIVTNNIPGTGSPAITYSRRVPASQDPYAISLDPSASAQPSAPNPLEGKRVRHKDTGQEGVIKNGVFIPDEQTSDQPIPDAPSPDEMFPQESGD